MGYTGYTKYTSNRQVDLILPNTAFPKYDSIKKIEPYRAITPYYKYQGLDDKRRALDRNKEQVKTFLSNYNDPTELNSYIDALTNREAVSKKFGEVWGTVSTTSGVVSVLSFAGAIIAAALAPATGGASLPVAAALAKVGGVAAIPAIPAAIDVTYNKGVKPILAGKPKEAVLNTLMNYGETMDFAANPVKGLVMEGGKGFIKGLGLSNEGRVNYDYDTGFFLTDMLLEIISDPMNWVSFGTSLGFKAAAKTVGQEYTENLTKSAVEVVNKYYAKTLGEIGEEGVERISKQVSNTAADVAREWAEKSFTKMTDATRKQLVKQGQQRIQTSLVNAIKKELPKANPSKITTLFQKMNRVVKKTQVARTVAEQISDITFDTLTSDVLKGLAGMRHYSSVFDKFMMKGALRSSGFGLGIDAAKKGFSDLRIWMNERTLIKLTQNYLFNKDIGLDIRNWEKAKNIWIETGKQTSVITGEVVERNTDTFFAFANQQFNRDMQLIREIQMQFKNEPIKIGAALDARFTEMYGTNFREYIGYLKGISKIEHGMFTDFINYAEAVNSVLARDAVAIQTGAKLTTGAQLWGAQKLEDLQKSQMKVFDKLYQQASKNKNTPQMLEKIYTIKLNDFLVNSALMHDPQISQLLIEIGSSEKIGAILNNILSDLKSLDIENSAIIPAAVRTIKEAGASFINMRELYNNIAKAIFPTIEGIADLDFKRYVIDQIFGLRYKTVSELLAGFDDITMPNLIHQIEEFLSDKGFHMNNYSGMQEQIAQAYKAFLEAQQRAGIDTVDSAIVQNFTKSASALVGALPADYADELAMLIEANSRIGMTLTLVREQNEMFMHHLLLDGDTIFGMYNTRQLSDLGLALKTVAVKNNLEIFEFPANVSGAIMTKADQLGKSVATLKEQFQQYTTYFDKTRTANIGETYKKVKEAFIDNVEEDIPNKAFRYLKDTNDVYEQYAQLVEFYKSVKEDNLLRKELQDTILPNTELLQDIANPNALLKTDFAWDDMAQSAWLAEKRFNENLINSVTAYNKLGVYSKKMTNDFATLRDLLSTNKLDRPLMLQQERYIRIATKYNNTLEYIREAYNNLFDHELAKQQIENLRNIFLYFPELNQKYSQLVDDLEDHWNGIKTFKQSPSYMRGQSDYVDEFTPFWNQIDEMNNEIHNIVTQHNSGKFNEFIDLRNAMYESEYQRFRDILDANKELFTQEKSIVYNDALSKFRKAKQEYYPKAWQAYHAQRKIIWEDTKAIFNKLDGTYTRNGKSYKRFANPTRQQLYDQMKAHTESIEKYITTRFKTHLKDLTHGLDTSYRLGKQQIDAAYDALFNQFEITDLEQLNQIYKSNYKTKQELYAAYRKQRQIAYEQCKLDIQREREVMYSIVMDDYRQVLLDHYKELAAGENAALYEFYKKNTHDDIEYNYKLLVQDPYDKASQKLYEEFVANNQISYEGFKTRYTQKADALYENYKAQRIQYNSVTPWDPSKKQQEFNKRVNSATNHNAQKIISRLFDYTPEQFVQELAFRYRFVTFKDEDIADKLIRERLDKFKKAVEADKRVVVVHEDSRYWFILNKDVEVTASGRQYYLNKNPIARVNRAKQFEEFEIVDSFLNDPNNPGLTKALNDLDEDMQKLVGSTLGDSQGEYLNKSALEQLFALDETGKPKNVPQKVWDAMPKDKNGNVFFDKQFFDAYHFNESILGTMKSKRELGMYSGNMITNMNNILSQAQAYLKPKNEYVATIFDSQFSIGNPKGIYAGFSNEDLLAALQLNPDYKLIALVDDAKYGVKTHEILPTSVKAIQKAKELGAVVVPLQTYKDMYNVVNHRLGSSGMAKLWNRIMYIYKFGYLLRPGAWIRNWFDTNIKSRLEMGDEFSTYKNQATKLIHERERIHELVKDSDGIIRTAKVKEYLDANPNNILSWETYQELELDFFSQGVSGNVMRQVIGEDAWATFTDLTGRILALPNKTEDYNRLAYYLYQLDKGYDTTSALAKLAKTHFDYSFKTKPEQLVEMFFPFTTFSMRNYSYWIEQVEKHPWIMRNYVHLMKPSWDFKDYTPEELARNVAAQNQILNGQIKLAELNNKILTFKANPSIQDAINMSTNPFTAIYEKLAAPISVPLKMATDEYVQPENILPVIGPMISSGKQMIEKGTPLPSAIGVQKKWKSFKPSVFKNNNYKGMNNYRDKQYRIPRYRNNMIYDSYSVKGVKRYRLNLYPIVDIAHEIKSRYSVNVYSRIKSRVETDVFKGIRYRLKLDVNRFR